ncbi:MAG TPA: tyrosine-type recombinase/integrase [Tepidisphaeraceae bacterium]|nr:tyrosine-type recombinase/integrase [Tepidisphaeraceae bacterium]
MAIESARQSVQRRTYTIKDAQGQTIRREYPCWYGRMPVNGKWKWHKLFTDKRASQARWNELVRQCEQRQAGVITTTMDAAKLPIRRHMDAYHEGLKRTATDAHCRIAIGMLDRFVKLAKWKTLADVNEQSAARVLSALEASGKTVAYCNQYLTRAKAFLNWCIPDKLPVNPLAKLKRGNIRKAVKRRARRPLAEHELAKLLNGCAADRRLKYAVPAYIGLRRKELAQVVWGDLHLESVIPYIQLRCEQTKTGEAVVLPLHPFLASELSVMTPGMPQAKLFASLPEGETMRKDLERMGIPQADASGRRADFHALRHTFAKRLDATGCSHATRRALMRHGAGDQTDGYTLAHLAEMYEAVKRLPAPALAVHQEQHRTGTDDTPISKILHPQDKYRTNLAPASATSGNHNSSHRGGQSSGKYLENNGLDADCHSLATSGLAKVPNPDIMLETGLRSSVG